MDSNYTIEWQKYFNVHGTNNPDWPYAGGIANGLELTGAENTVYAWAKAENDIADQLTSGSTATQMEKLCTVTKMVIRLFAYDGVGSNFGEYLTGLQNYNANTN